MFHLPDSDKVISRATNGPCSPGHIKLLWEMILLSKVVWQCHNPIWSITQCQSQERGGKSGETFCKCEEQTEQEQCCKGLLRREWGDSLRCIIQEWATQGEGETSETHWVWILPKRLQQLDRLDQGFLWWPSTAVGCARRRCEQPDNEVGAAQAGQEKEEILWRACGKRGIWRQKTVI